MITPNLLEATVKGDLTPITRLREASHVDLVDAWQRSSRPILKSVAVATVIDALLSRRFEPGVVQAWASLMRRGYLEETGPAIRPLDIAYEAAAEDQIIEAIDALDQLGDSVDGTISDGRLMEMLGNLSARGET